LISKNRNGKGKSSGTASGKAAEITRLIMASCMALCSFAGSAFAVESGVTITYAGTGAGQVPFDGTLHAAKGLTCADCHEPHLMLPALFEMKKNAEKITMNKIERGRSCGRCHEVSMTDFLACSKCHQNK
jgi:c(7)-type cytochrome triheme protein